MSAITDEYTPENGDDVLLKLTMPGKELRPSTIEKKEAATQREQEKKSEQQLSPDPEIDWLSKIARSRTGNGEFMDNLESVNAHKEQMPTQPRESGPIIGVVPRNTATNQPYLNSMASASLAPPAEEAPFFSHQDPISAVQQVSGEQEVMPAVQEVPKSQPSQGYADPYDPYNIFGKVQPERDDARPLPPPHHMNHAMLEKVEAVTKRMFDSDVILRRLKK